MNSTSPSTQPKFTIRTADDGDIHYAEEICEVIAESARQRGTGIAKREPDYIRKKIHEGKAIIAFADNGHFAGFCYIETWEHGKYVANSGLIVAPEFRKQHLARRVKKAVFDLSRKRFPDAKIFGITTSAAVLKINSDLGYRAAHFNELTVDESFWKGCQSCNNFDILQRTQRTMCLCTGMLFDPNHESRKSSAGEFVSISLPAITTDQLSEAHP